jgi:hypothetical protein
VCLDVSNGQVARGICLPVLAVTLRINANIAFACAYHVAVPEMPQVGDRCA